MMNDETSIIVYFDDLQLLNIFQIEEGGCLGSNSDQDSTGNKYFFNYLMIPGGKQELHFMISMKVY